MNWMSGERRLGFTAKQGQYLAFIDAYTRVHRRPPAEADMQRHFGVTPPSVHQMILTLERAGLIRRQPGVPRSVEVLVPYEDLPVLGDEKHRPPAAWRVVSQKQGRLKPTLRMKGVAINDDAELEREADVMGNTASRVADGSK